MGLLRDCNENVTWSWGVSSEGLLEGALSTLTYMVVGGVQFLVGCLTENPSVWLTAGQWPLSFPCYVSPSIQ